MAELSKEIEHGFHFDIQRFAEGAAAAATGGGEGAPAAANKVTNVPDGKADVSLNNIIDDVITGDKGGAEGDKGGGEGAPAAGAGESGAGDLAKAQANVETIAADLKAKGIDFSKFESELASSTGLSDASYEALLKAGYSKAVVDTVVNSYQMAANGFVASVKAAAGGDEEFTKVLAFIKTQPQDVQNAYNQALDTKNVGLVKAVLGGIKAAMGNQLGNSGEQIIANSGGGSGVNATPEFLSVTDMVTAISDDRYQKDAAYTKEVIARINRSKGLFETADF